MVRDQHPSGRAAGSHLSVSPEGCYNSGMRRFFPAIILLCLLPVTAAAEDTVFPSLQVKLENYIRAATVDEDSPILLDQYPAEDFTVRGDSTMAFGGMLSAYPARFYGLERYELTRFDTALGGAGKAATMGLFLGAFGTTAGWMDDDAAWAISGSMAVLGAILGATRGYGDPASRVRFRWAPPPQLEGADALHPQNK